MSLLPLTDSLDTKTDEITPHVHDNHSSSATTHTTPDPISSTLAHLLTNSISSIPSVAHHVDHHIVADISVNNNSNTSMNQDTSHWLEMPKVENFIDVFSIGCSIAVIFGGLVPYIPQYLKIKRLSNSDGFSTYVCLTLLIANILRIMFWIGHRFELPLLIQSFVMIAGMLAMMEICVRVKNRASYTISAIGVSTNQKRRIVNGKMNETNDCDHDNNSLHESESMPIYSVLSSSASSTSPETISSCSYHDQQQAQIDIEIAEATIAPAIVATSASSDLSIHNSGSFEYPVLNDSSSSLLCQTSLLQRSQSSGTIKCSSHEFWDWDDYFSYVKFLSLFTIIMSLSTYLLRNNYMYIELIGFVAVFTESMLGMPQLLRNYTKKSTVGMSVEMVVMWLSGDLFKTLYFILKRAPAQFYVCGSIQVVVDILILGQVLLYKRPNVTYSKLAGHPRPRQ